jgi:citrate lyase subunit beta/citryl-CoA lyase
MTTASGRLKVAPRGAPGTVRRSELTTPGHSLKMIGGAAASKADLVMMDLEDACAPSQKVAARATVVEAAKTLDWGGKIVAFRPNNLRTAYFLDDLLEVVGCAGAYLDALILPKTERPDEVRYVDQLLHHLEEKFGLEVGRLRLEVLIESAQGVSHAEEIATASPRLAALIFGVADYAGDVGALLTTDTFTDFAYAKQRTVAAARAAGLSAIDCITPRFRDVEQTRRDAEAARRMGFDGKWAIHPAQIDVINAAFTPTDEELRRAEELLRAYRAADVEKGLGAIVVGDEMVDKATLRVEERKIAIGRKIGKVAGNDG